MPAINDHWAEVDHLRRLVQEQQTENARLGDILASTRQEMDESQREARNLRAEVQRLQVEVSDERKARRTAEAALRQRTSAEMTTAINRNNRTNRDEGGKW